MSWSERYRANQAAAAVNYGNTVTPGKNIAEASIATIETVSSVNNVHSVNASHGSESHFAPPFAGNAERAADEAAERAAIQAEPPLPLQGTAGRERLDAVQRTTLAGLLAGAKVSRWLPSKKAMHATEKP